MVEFGKLHKMFCAYMHFLTVVGDSEKCCFICRKSVRKPIYYILLCWNEKLWDKWKYYNAIKGGEFRVIWNCKIFRIMIIVCF